MIGKKLKTFFFEVEALKICHTTLFVNCIELEVILSSCNLWTLESYNIHHIVILEMLW